MGVIVGGRGVDVGVGGIGVFVGVRGARVALGEEVRGVVLPMVAAPPAASEGVETAVQAAKETNKNTRITIFI